jgi:hypothetical protein
MDIYYVVLKETNISRVIEVGDIMIYVILFKNSQNVSTIIVTSTRVDDSGHRIQQDPEEKMRESHLILQENTGITRNRPFSGGDVRPG